MQKLESKGIQLCKSKHTKRCQLCRKHQSKYRRTCPICGRLIAPGCWPVQCWSDELNHCRNCHAVIGTLKHIRFKLQYMTNLPGMDLHEHLRFKLQMTTKSRINTRDPWSNVVSYEDFPVGIQINIMLYLFEAKDFVWSGYYTSKHPSAPTCGCPSCTYFVSQA